MLLHCVALKGGAGALSLHQVLVLPPLLSLAAS